MTGIVQRLRKRKRSSPNGFMRDATNIKLAAADEIERLRKRIAMFVSELEDIKVTIGAMLDPDSPPLLKEDFAKMKPARQR